MSVLIYDLDRGFRVWHIDEIYMGPSSDSPGRTVPNVDDMIIDWSRGIFKVTKVDNTIINPTSPTYTPTLELVDLNALLLQNTLGTNKDFYLYQPSVLELAFLNQNVTPFTISIDDRYRAYGTEVAFAKAFKGTNVSNTGQVISKVFNGNGQLVGENIAMELIDSNNPAIKRPLVFNTTTAMYDGEVITLVLYTQAGGPIGKHSFLIQNSDAIRGLGNDTIYIVDIKLVTTLLDDTELDLINVPANIPITGGDFMAKLIYNDGSSHLINIGTNKCKLHGLTSFNTGIVGPRSSLVLTYYPEVGEPIINSSNPAIRTISHTYEIRAITNNLDSFFKIYIVPHFNEVTNKYNLDYWLTNLDYTVLTKLTASQYNVRLAGNSGNPIIYDAGSDPQTIVVNVDMESVFSVGYTGYHFVQSIGIQFGQPWIVPWYIDYRGINTDIYGDNVGMHCNNAGLKPIDLSMGLTSKASWLAALWTPIYAIWDDTVSAFPTTPTYFQLRYKGVLSQVYSVLNDWDSVINNEFGVDWENNTTISVIWLYPAGPVGTYKKLGISPIMLKTDL